MSRITQQRIEELRELMREGSQETWEFRRYEECMIPEHVVELKGGGGYYTICGPVHTNPYTEANMKKIAALHNAASDLLDAAEEGVRLKAVGSEIKHIMETYREQERYGCVDTPGGLEHMGDVWALLGRWDRELRALKEGGK